MNPIARIKRRWHEPDGYKQVLLIAIPLILSTGSWSVYHFIDRMFLTWYSPDAIAASMPSGILNFTLMSFFIGAAGYVTTFVAQYHGARQNEKIGPIIWQGIYLSIIGGILIACTIPLARPFFDAIGHKPPVSTLEGDFFIWLCPGAFFAIAASAISGFFSGRSKTLPVMWISLLSTGITITGDYLLIFGHCGFPELGIKGAAIATDISALFSFFAYSILIFNSSHNKSFGVLNGWRFNLSLFRLLVKFGVPSGVQFFLDVAGFTAFIMLVGTLGTVPLAASNIAFSINTLAFMPMIGVGIAVSVLVGQNLGAKKPESAQKSAWSGFHLALGYMIAIAALYMFAPNLFLNPYLDNNGYENAGEIKSIASILLRFVAVYTIFDTFNMVFGSALKGAGDTRYVMISNMILSLVLLVIPTYILLVIFGKGIFSAWYVATIYVIALAMNFLIRFMRGKWKLIKIIEEHPPKIPACCPPEVPTVE